MRLQMLLHSLISQAVRENNEELTRQIRETITKEMDYQFRVQEEKTGNGSRRGKAGKKSISGSWTKRFVSMRKKEERERQRAVFGRRKGSRRKR